MEINTKPYEKQVLGVFVSWFASLSRTQQRSDLVQYYRNDFVGRRGRTRGRLNGRHRERIEAGATSVRGSAARWKSIARSLIKKWDDHLGKTAARWWQLLDAVEVVEM